MDGPERSLLRELLKYSDQRCKKLVELTEEGVWIFDRDEVTTFVNSEMARMLGCSSAEMLGLRPAVRSRGRTSEHGRRFD